MNNIDKQVKREAKYDIVQQVVGVLSALLPFLSIVGVNLDWFNEDFIESFAVLLSSVIFLGINVYTIWKNHFSSKRAQEQNKILKNKGMK